MKKLLSVVTAFMLSVTSMAFTPMCAHGAGTGTWKLVKTNYIVADHVYDTAGRGGSRYEFDFSYEGIKDGSVQFKISGGWYDVNEGDSQLVDQYFACSQPKDSIASGETVSLNLRLITDNLVLIQSNHVIITHLSVL